jgi:alcohol dehydrogenase (cytochrome c)
MLAAAGLAAAEVHATVASGQATGVYTAQQAEEGHAEFDAACAACHNKDLSGAEGPPLAGPFFLENWKTQTTKDLFAYMQGMPPGGPALTTEQYLKILAYVLQQNGAPAGDQPIAESTAVAIGTIATGKKPE